MAWKSLLLFVLFMAVAVGETQHEDQVDERERVLRQKAEAMEHIGKELHSANARRRAKRVQQAHTAMAGASKAEKGSLRSLTRDEKTKDDKTRGPVPNAERIHRIADDLKQVHKNLHRIDGRQGPRATAQQRGNTIGHDAAMKNAHEGMSRHRIDVPHAGKTATHAGDAKVKKMTEEFAKALDAKRGRASDVPSRTAVKEAHYKLGQQLKGASEHEKKKAIHGRFRDAVEPVRKNRHDDEEH